MMPSISSMGSDLTRALALFGFCPTHFGVSYLGQLYVLVVNPQNKSNVWCYCHSRWFR